MSKRKRSQLKILFQPYGPVKLGELLQKLLKGEYGEFNSFQAAVAFAKRSGVKHISAHISETIQQGNKVRIVIGVDHHGTSQEGLEDLLECCHPDGEVWINHCIEKYVTFHPKLYLFQNERIALVIVGSQNLTQGGLYTNDEVSTVHWLNLNVREDAEFLNEVNSYFDTLCNPDSENAKKLSNSILKKLVAGGDVLPESLTSEEGEMPSALSIRPQTAEKQEAIFAKSEVKRNAPHVRLTKTKAINPATAKDTETKVVARGFVMTLQRTDVGSGQATPGANRRSPEIFIPLAARDYFPRFWGWKELFNEDQNRSGKFDRIGVRMRIGGETVLVNMMTWPIKHDFRLRSEVLRSSGNVGDIIRIEKVYNSDEFDYYVEIIPKGTSSYEQYFYICSNITRNSKKVWGYYS